MKPTCGQTKLKAGRRPRRARTGNRRLAYEYELLDRHRALDSTLDVVARTVKMPLGLVQAHSSARVGRYIVRLIIAPLIVAYPPLLARQAVAFALASRPWTVQARDIETAERGLELAPAIALDQSHRAGVGLRSR